MDFYAVVAQVIELLRSRERVSYRALKLQLQIDDGTIEALKDELIYAQRVAVDEESRLLVWTGGVGATPAPAPIPSASGPSDIPRDLPAEVALRPVETHPPEAERRQLTVLFCDLVGSTQLSGQLDPEDLRAVVRAYQEAAAEIIQRYEGHIAQYLGDGLLVYFGYPAAHEDDARRAVHVGLGMVQAIATLNTRLAAPYGVQLAVRVGIHTGPVVVGQMGGGGRYEHLALGETPNLAARLQSLAPANAVVISAVTARLVHGIFALEDLGTHALPGVAEPMAVSRVRGLLATLNRDEEFVAAGVPLLVGRDEEVGLLRRRWEQSKAGHGQVVLISGEAGIGKSALVASLRAQVRAEGLPRMVFRGSPYHTNSALYPVITHLDHLLQLESDDPPATKLAKLEAGLRPSGLPLVEVVPLFAGLLSVPLPAERYAPLKLTPPQQKQQTLDALVTWLAAEAERQPVLVAWEDLYWTDPTTLELLGLVVDQAPTVPMLHVLTYRPEFSPPWPQRSHITPLVLNRLERPQVEALIAQRGSYKTLPAEVVQHIVAKTDGVPLYVEELTKMLLASPLLREEESQYVLTGPLHAVAIPDTLQDALMARLDQLNRAKEVAQLGAVLGREFAYDLLQAIAPQDEDTLQAGLEQLVAAELLYQRGRPPRARYIFKHALIQDAAYASLLKSTRQQVHQQIAQVFEAQFHALVETQPELVAQHYTAAGCHEPAVRYWQRAGQHASDRSANVEAISHRTTGIELLTTLPDTPEHIQQALTLYIGLGAALQMAKGLAAPEVEHAYTQARALCQQVGETPQLVPVLFGLWRFYLVRSQLHTAQELGETLLRLAQQAHDPALAVIANYTLGATWLFLGALPAARQHLEEGIARYTPDQRRAVVFRMGPDPGVGCRLYAALTLWLLGSPTQALTRLHEALALAHELSHPYSLAWARGWAAVVSQLRQDVPAAYEHAEAAIALSTELDFPHWAALGTSLRGWARAMQGQSEEGMAQVRQGIAAYRAIGEAVLVPYFCTVLAEIYDCLGHPEDGLQALAEVHTLVEQQEERWWEAEVARLLCSGMMSDEPDLGSHHRWGGEVVTFDEVLEQALEMLRRRGRVSYRALKVQFHLDDDLLEILKEEIVAVHQLGRDQEGTMLVWTGDTATAAVPVSPPTPDPVRAPLTYTPPYLAEKIFTSRAALEGERKQVTVLFADLKGSTELIEGLDPEEARRLLDPALHVMMDAVHRYEGTVNQVLGDGIMALFGAPVAHEDHAVRACYAALAMQAAMRRYAEAVRRSHGLEMPARVGLNSGEVVVRSIGNDLHMDYSAVGQTTHLAARMEQLATPGSIRLTAATLRLAEGLVQVNALGPFPVKGLAEPVEVFELVGASAIRRRLQASAARGLTRFVGRQQEVTALQQALEQAGAGHGQVVALVGEAGVGKSRLVYEFVQSHHTPGWLVLESASVSYGQATSYLPVIDVLKLYSHVEERDDTRTIRAKVTGQVLTLDPALQDTVPALLALLDAVPEDSPFFRLDPPQRRQRTLDALKRVVLRESQEQSLLLVFEDLHWIDAETQALLNSLVESLPTSRLLLLVNYRPEYQHGWGSKTYYTQLRLDPLPPVRADEFLQALLGDDPGLKPLTDLLIARTEGNPFFLEESVHTLVETGVLVGERAAYRLGHALSGIQVPATVQAVLAARIDRLPAEAKRLLQTAAVIGTEVPLPLLHAIAELPEAGLQRHLTALQSAEFLYETRLFPEHEYTFKHALTHEVAYGSLLLERRRVLHARIVEALEALAGERVAEVASGRSLDQVERLAHHALRGEVWAKALARSAYREAVGSFEQALSALLHLPETRDTREQAIDLRLALHTALFPSGDSERILAALREAETLAEAIDDQRRLGQVSAFLSNYFYRMGAYDQAIASAQRALALATAGGEVGLLALANERLGAAYQAQGDYRRAIDYFRQTLTSLEGARRRELFGQVILPAVHSRAYLTACHAELGLFAEGRDLGEEGLRIAEAVAHPASLAFASSGIGLLSLRQGDLRGALPLLERAVGLCQDADFPFWFPWAAAVLGTVYTLDGRVADAVPLLTQAMEQTTAMERVDTQALCSLSLGEAQLLAGRLEAAHAVAEEALAHAHERQERGHEAYALRLFGDIAARRDPPEGEPAVAHYQQALTLADALGMRPLQAHCHRGLGTLYVRRGQWEQARTELGAARDLYQAMAMTFWLPQVEAVLAQAEER